MGSEHSQLQMMLEEIQKRLQFWKRVETRAPGPEMAVSPTPVHKK